MREFLKKRRIAVMTSGGDAPGMNAAIRGIVRIAVYNGIEVLGIERGYEGLLGGNIIELSPRSVSDIIYRGGTILKTARCKEMRTEEGQKRAAEICHVLGIETLMIIGGDGSLTGGLKLSQYGVNIIGIPATIDLDFYASEYTIGFDTAVNTAMEAINKIRDTSGSHERCSVIEVMGRDCGAIALWCAVTCGAEEVLFPERKNFCSDDVIEQIIRNRAKGKRHNLIVVAEGIGGTIELSEKIEKVTGIETRATILGHLQRGGAPSAKDRYYGSMMGYEAVQCFLRGEQNRVIVTRDGKFTTVDIQEAIDTKPSENTYLYDIIKELSI